MQAGKLRSWISIEQASPTQDGFGAPVNTWVSVLRCWAHLAPVTGREVYTAAAGFSGQLTHKVTIRYTTVAIAPGMLVRFGAKTFLVQAPPMNPDERNQELDLLCLEQAA